MLISENIVIEGIQYRYSPVRVSLTTELSSTTQIALLNGGSFANLQGTLVPDSQIDAARRIVGTQIINMEWDGVPRDLKEHLEQLHTTQKPVFIQFDEEFSFDYTQAYDITGEGTCFFTPTYPIVPYGKTPLNSNTHVGNVYIDDGVTVQPLSSGFSINETLGAILFDRPLDNGVKVFVSYTWKCPVVLVSFNSAEYENVAKQGYSVSASFVQVPSSLVAEDKWSDVADMCYIDDIVPTGATSTASSVPVGFRM